MDVPRRAVVGLVLLLPALVSSWVVAPAAGCSNAAATVMPAVHRRHVSPKLMPKPVTPPDLRMLYIDGNNLMSHRKVTKGRDELAAKLAGIRGSQVTLVFDGKRGEGASDSGSDPRVVVTRGGNEETGADRETADEWIERAIEDGSHEIVEVVTADRTLRRIAQASSVKTINPAKFWTRYLPRLKGMKNDYRNAPKAELLE